MIKKVVKSPVNYKNNIVNFAASLMNNYNVNSQYESHALVDYILSKRYRHVAVILLDGNSIDTIDQNTGNGSIFRTHQIMKLHTVYPPTTVAATTALLTGKAPIESGWLGWHLYLDDKNPSVILFQNKDYYSGEQFTGYQVTDKIYATPWYTNLKRTVVHEIYPSFKENGYKTFNEACDKLEEYLGNDEHNFTYLYWDDPDTTMHEFGVHSPVVKVKIEEIEQRLVKLNENLPNNCCVFVIADHGQVNVEYTSLDEYPEVTKLLAKPISGEGRFAQFHLLPGKDDEFKALFAANFADDFDLYSKEEFINSHLAGLYEPHPTTKYSLGDYCAIAKTNKMFAQNIKKDDFTFVGHHAGLTSAELDIPVILFKRKDEVPVEE